MRKDFRETYNRGRNDKAMKSEYKQNRTCTGKSSLEKNLEGCKSLTGASANIQSFELKKLKPDDFQ